MAQGLPVSPRWRRSRPGGRSTQMGRPGTVTRVAVPVGPMAVSNYKPESEPADSFLLYAIRNGSTVTADYLVTVFPFTAVRTSSSGA